MQGGEKQSPAEWAVKEMEGLATVRWNPKATKTLGVMTGDVEDLREQLAAKNKVDSAMRESLREIGDACTEITMQTNCLGTSKITHILRARGAEPEVQTTLKNFASNRQNALRELLPGIEESGLEQAKLRTGLGGLGWQGAHDVAQQQPSPRRSSTNQGWPGLRKTWKDWAS